MITTTNEFGVHRFCINLPTDSHAAVVHRSTGASAHRALRPSVRVAAAADEADWEQARELILEHLQWIAGSLGFPDPLALQVDLREEMADLRSVYTPPRGARYLAWLDEQPVGTVGFAVGPDGAAEMRRLYVRPAGRGHNLGEVLMRATLAEAGELGCRMAWLETMPGLMEPAISIYRRLGFRERVTDKVSVPGAIRMERPLVPASGLVR